MVWNGARRAIALGFAFFVPCAVIVFCIRSIVRDGERRRPPAPSATSVAAPSDSHSAADTTASVPPSAAPPPEPLEKSAAEFYEETDDGEPKAVKKAAPKHYASVEQAAVESCTTASVEGLSRQIIQQARCIKPAAFAELPARTNLVLASNVFPYLESKARDRLLRVLDAHPSQKMTINSALRTVAQQYLVSRWAGAKRCGVPLATRPGESNHEFGIALDIAEPARWRPVLEAQGFRWLGKSDRVHFDYQTPAPPSDTATDVLAFQILWNKNHAADGIVANGRYTPATEQRLKKTPASGFPIGPSCGKPVTPKRP
jgi:hypothetical protein